MAGIGSSEGMMRDGEAVETGSRRSILVIDDNAPLRAALGEMLEAEGWSVTLCPDGPTAIQYASAADYDVVLVDFSMPGIRGHVVTEMLRVLVPGACIIGISLHDRKEAFLAAGADAFLQKPFDAGEVARITRQKAEAAASGPAPRNDR